MEMNYIHEEKKIIARVKKYLVNIGYGESSLFEDYKLDNRSYVDLAIREGDQLIGIIEVKGKELLNLSDKDELPYSRVIRRTQSLADEHECDFFIVSDGTEHVWMRTSQTGRAIVIPEQKNKKDLSTKDYESKHVKHVLSRSLNYLRENSLNSNYFFDFSIVLTELLESFEFNGTKPIHYLDFTKKTQKLLKKKYSDYPDRQLQVIAQANEMISSLRGQLSAHSKSILSFIDEILAKRNKELYVPQWLNLLMLDMSGANPNSKILNLFSRDGSIADSAFERKIKDITLVESSEDALIWAKLRLKLLGGNESQILFYPSITHGDFPDLGQVDNIVMAPPFNTVLNNDKLNNKRALRTSDGNFIYIMESLNLLEPDGVLAVIVPDGFLFNQSSKDQRNQITKIAKLEGIISLPSKTFHPYSSVSSSLVIFRNGLSTQSSDNVFFGVLSNEKSTDKLNENIKKIVSSYREFNSQKKIKESYEAFTVNDLDINNWHHSKYSHEKFSELENNLSEYYSLIPLKEILSNYSKGSGFVKDSDGEIAYVNPANIREMSLNPDKLLYTNPEKIKGSYFPLEINDIVINAISNYRGVAAIVDDELFVGLGANRHVIILRPNPKFIDPYYLALIINSEHVRKQLFDLTTGAVIPSISMKTLETLFIPVPDLNEQRKIAGVYREKKKKLSHILKEASKLEIEAKNLINNIGK